MKGHLISLRSIIIQCGLALLVACAALVAAQPAKASHGVIPARSSPDVQCSVGRWDGVARMTVSPPNYVTTPYRSEEVRVRFHLLRKVNGVWKYDIGHPEVYAGYATYAGAVSNGWSPIGQPLLNNPEAVFFINVRGDYRVAMEMKWMTSGHYTYEWAGRHFYYDPWSFTEITTPSCVFS